MVTIKLLYQISHGITAGKWLNGKNEKKSGDSKDSIWQIAYLPNTPGSQVWIIFSMGRYDIQVQIRWILIEICSTEFERT